MLIKYVAFSDAFAGCSYVVSAIGVVRVLSVQYLFLFCAPGFSVLGWQESVMGWLRASLRSCLGLNGSGRQESVSRQSCAVSRSRLAPNVMGVRVIVQVASAGCSYVVSALESRLPRASAGRGDLIRRCLVHFLVVCMSWRGHGTLLPACGIFCPQ